MIENYFLLLINVKSDKEEQLGEQYRHHYVNKHLLSISQL